MHSKRLAVAAILLPVFYFYVMKLPRGYFFGLMLLVSVTALWEFYAMYRTDRTMMTAGIGAGAALFVTAYVSGKILFDAAVLFLMLLASVRLFSGRTPLSSLVDSSFAFFGVLYISGLLVFQLFLRDHGPQWVVFLYGCVWASDSFAYYIGRGIGKRKLYERVSPNKTVAGAVGSVLGGTLAGWLLKTALMNRLSIGHALALGFIIGATTIIGDLVESMFKRDAGVKDSSNIIPGHGGVLDKIDGVLFAGPVLYLVSRALGLLK